MRLIVLAIAVSSLGGCAILGFETRESVAETAVAPDRPALSPVSFRKSEPPTSRKTTAIGRPAGLVPCASGARLDDDCWRKGDRHYLFVEDMPDGLQPAGRGPVVDVSADGD